VRDSLEKHTLDDMNALACECKGTAVESGPRC
jgi:hypothetical protein